MMQWSNLTKCRWFLNIVSPAVHTLLLWVLQRSDSCAMEDPILILGKSPQLQTWPHYRSDTASQPSVFLSCFFHVGEQKIVRWCQIRRIWRVINQFIATITHSSHCNHRLLVKQDSLRQFPGHFEMSLILLFWIIYPVRVYLEGNNTMLVSGKQRRMRRGGGGGREEGTVTCRSSCTPTPMLGFKNVHFRAREQNSAPSPPPPPPLHYTHYNGNTINMITPEMCRIWGETEWEIPQNSFIEIRCVYCSKGNVERQAQSITHFPEAFQHKVKLDFPNLFWGVYIYRYIQLYPTFIRAGQIKHYK